MTTPLIIGGGIAGLFCALRLAPRPVTLLTAAPIGEGASSAWAQGGIAAAVAEGDTVEAHARDTIAAGAGLVDAAAAHALAREAPDRIEDLLRYGVPFDRDLEGRLAVGREAAHSARRIVHVGGDRAGAAIMAALAAAVRNTPSITLIEGHEAEELIVDDGRVTGLIARRLADQQQIVLAASAVVLATGGIGHLYAVTTNPPQAAGQGLAIAARAGARIADAEFVQFHPTAIDIGRDPAPLATEAIRGDGATLVNRSGVRFMLALHPDAELAPRDIVARGVFAELAAGRGAFLDARTAIGGDFARRFPSVTESCLTAGINPSRDLIPVAPAAHYHMGGIATDPRGRTSIPGLWAAGEVASTGVHGANRLASNSLLEGVVYAARVADDIAAQPQAPPQTQRAPSPQRGEGRGEGVPAFQYRAPEPPHPPFSPPGRRSETPCAPNTAGTTPENVRPLMSRHVGVIRDAAGLAHAITALTRLERDAQSPAARNSALAALFIATAAWRRRESRGGHFRSDFPAPDPHQAQRVSLTLTDVRNIVAEAAHQPEPAHAE